MGAGTETETMEECCLLACSPWLAQPAFLSYRTTAQEWHKLKSPILIINKENAPINFPSGQGSSGVFSAEILYSQMILACVKLTKTNNQTKTNQASFLTLLENSYYQQARSRFLEGSKAWKLDSQ